MRAIVIPCSGKKDYGGSEIYDCPRLPITLGKACYSDLIELRKEIARMLGLEPGPDLFGEMEGNNIKFEPAFERYNGILYQYSNFSALYPKFQGKVFIISALYGLLDASDFIRYYDLKMEDILPSGQKVYQWWRNNGIEYLLKEALNGSGATEVYDFLSINYRRAVSLNEHNEKYKVYKHKSKNIRYSSLYETADKLKEVLSIE